MTKQEYSLSIRKMYFGYALLVLLGALAAVIALGTVEQKTSHGLDQILGGLLVLSGAFGHWAFGSSTASTGGVLQFPKVSRTAKNDKEEEEKKVA